MSTKIVSGHTISENDQYVIVNKRSEHPLGALLGFLLGCLLALLVVDQFDVVGILFIVIGSTFLGAIISTSRRSESIPKHRVVRIRKRWGRVDVDYVVHEDPMLDLLEK